MVPRCIPLSPRKVKGNFVLRGPAGEQQRRRRLTKKGMRKYRIPVLRCLLRPLLVLFVLLLLLSLAFSLA